MNWAVTVRDMHAASNLLSFVCREVARIVDAKPSSDPRRAAVTADVHVTLFEHLFTAAHLRHKMQTTHQFNETSPGCFLYSRDQFLVQTQLLS